MRSTLALALTLALGTAIASPVSDGQAAPKVWRLGALWPTTVSSDFDALLQGLRDLNYVEGQNLIIEHRSAQSQLERLPEFASELARLKVDIVFAWATPAARAAKDATSTIPIVMVVGEPVGVGLVQSLARPGGNVTGLSLNNAEVAARRLQLLKEVAPRITRIAVITNQGNPGFTAIHLQAMRPAAETLGLQLREIGVRAPDQLEDAFRAMLKERVEGVNMLADPMWGGEAARRIATFARQHRLVSIYDSSSFTERGGLLAYGPNTHAIMRRAAWYIDRILKGVSPRNLPVEQPTEFRLVINLGTAKVLGLTIPQSVLIRADHVITFDDPDRLKPNTGMQPPR